MDQFEIDVTPDKSEIVATPQSVQAKKESRVTIQTQSVTIIDKETGKIIAEWK